MQEALAWSIGLNPLSVEDELRDGALAGVRDDFVGCSGGGLDVDLGIGDRVVSEETLGLATVSTPGGGVDDQFHGSILREGAM